MFNNRLLFGIVMALILLGIVLLDAKLDGSFSSSVENKPVQGTGLAILIALVAFPALSEIGGLIRQAGARIFKWIAIPSSMLLATAFYWPAFSARPVLFFGFYLAFVLAGTVVGVFFMQAVLFRTEGTIRNCSATLFSVLYLGLLSGFVMAIRVDFGPWALLTFIFTIKSADIGAYYVGSRFGKRKMIPSISPGKTWEGLAGGIVLASIVSCVFSTLFGIMAPAAAILFGAVFAVLGQLSDLAESMIKRDASAKDSSHSIPGFGGILDVIDSILGTAPVAYAVLYFMK